MRLHISITANLTVRTIFLVLVRDATLRYVISMQEWYWPFLERFPINSLNKHCWHWLSVVLINKFTNRRRRGTTKRGSESKTKFHDDIMAYKLPCQRHLQECVHKWYSRIILIHLTILEEISALFGTHTWLYTESADRSINILFPWTKWSQIPSCLQRLRIGLLCSP